jgi:acyl-CoA reductase-like NAD-dependent aldehyde dehydrogenase
MSVATQTGDSVESFNPATGERLGTVPAAAPAEVAAIVGDVAEVQPFWAQLPLSDRARYMRRTAQVLIDNLDELSALLAREQGKPRSETYLTDLLPTIDALHWIAAHGERTLADRRVRHRQPLLLQKRSTFSFEPLGVLAVLSAWSNPWSAPFGQAAIALMCGNGVVLKPAPLTPLIGQRIQDTFERAGLPEGLVRTVHGDGTAGAALVESNVAGVFFTGSAEAGRRVGARCAELMRRSLLELGGNDPQIVLADAPLDHAVAGCLWAGFANAGQTSAGIGRVYVVRDVADAFVSGVVDGARALRVGDPLEWATEIGPLVSADQRDRLVALLDEAVSQGATLRCGGVVGVEGMSGAFFAPAVLTGVHHDMRVMREEVCGPVVPIAEVASEEEAIRLANDARFGLGASVWTLDVEKGKRIARRLAAGTVWLNDHMYTHGPWQCSWGGVNGSGLGRIHSPFAFYQCVDTKRIVCDRSRARSFYWHPYDETLGQALGATAQILWGRDADKRSALRAGAVPLAKLARRTLRGALTRG